MLGVKSTVGRARGTLDGPAVDLGAAQGRTPLDGPIVVFTELSILEKRPMLA